MDAFNSFLATVKPVFELAYFIASIGLAFFAYYGLQQITVLKTTAASQARRDALRLTSEQCAIYMDKIISAQNEFNDGLKASGNTWFEGWTIDINGREVRAHRTTPQDKADFTELNIIQHLNLMEAFSVYFASRLADEKVAYRTVGKTFVGHLDHVMPFVLMARKDGHYQNLVSLYVTWKARAEAEKLAFDQKKIDSKLSKLRSASATASPVGSDYD